MVGPYKVEYFMMDQNSKMAATSATEHSFNIDL